MWTRIYATPVVEGLKGRIHFLPWWRDVYLASWTEIIFLSCGDYYGLIHYLIECTLSHKDNVEEFPLQKIMPGSCDESPLVFFNLKLVFQTTIRAPSEGKITTITFTTRLINLILLITVVFYWVCTMVLFISPSIVWVLHLLTRCCYKITIKW